MSYKTKQKNLIIDVIKSYKKQFTIKDIYNQIGNQCGLTTIYRLVDKLVNDGLINKYIDNDNVTYYEYLEKCDFDNHFYLKCEKCGSMEHIDCDCILKLSEHITNEHNFSLDRENIIIKGICKECK